MMKKGVLNRGSPQTCQLHLVPKRGSVSPFSPLNLVLLVDITDIIPSVLHKHFHWCCEKLNVGAGRADCEFWCLRCSCVCVCVCAHFWGSLLQQTWRAGWLSSWYLPTASTHSPACLSLILSFIQWDPGEFLNIVSDSDLWYLKSTYVQSLLGQFSGELAHQKRKWISQLEGEWKHLEENVTPRLGSLTCISYSLTEIPHPLGLRSPWFSSLPFHWFLWFQMSLSLLKGRLIILLSP